VRVVGVYVECAVDVVPAVFVLVDGAQAGGACVSHRYAPISRSASVPAGGVSEHFTW
jgi:hypothetical protein